MKKTCAVLAMTLCLGACGSSVPDAQSLAAIGTVGASVLSTTEVGELEPARWPSAITSLGPERVYLAEEGLYIVTSSSFVQERGLFVPRDANFVPEAGADPAYVSIRKGVYAYRIEG